MKLTLQPLAAAVLALALPLAALAQQPTADTAVPHPVLPLYTGSIPDSKPSRVQETTTNPPGGVEYAGVVQPTLTVFLPPPGQGTGTSVIICPGGGYAHLAFEKEGTAVAQRLNQLGVAAFVLKYRLPSPQAQPDPSLAPLLDVQQALRLVRQQAGKYGLNPDRIGVMGFSAGGHLAATASTHFAQPAGPNPGPEPVRPAFAVLLYPVISFADTLKHTGSVERLLGASPSGAQIREYSNELHVTAQTPPTFLVHAEDDQVVPVQNSLVYYQALSHHKVPAEMHLYPKGGHGFGLNNSTTQDQWFDRLREWLAANGWLTR